ncbi:hypothetical protein HELRODRAFT_188055 [Helobdella robusta]|uniref:Laminin EGF-like domain-containing protein n=1 Tax=Helobdella robusta TaxID=6412 RepID=T1FPL0_HELRO|nr:hypothetical protein HELRODRAFT_188055 [Helobdella robusta]ESO12949.1 hypothetical protein HELRODRAFT_188055 [Helobdella robusta]
MPAVRTAPLNNPSQVLCSEDESDISPLTDASVVFTTLSKRMRPKKIPFDELPALYEFTTASDIMISLIKMNTWGDEAFDEPRAQAQYFYAIKEINVGGRLILMGIRWVSSGSVGILRCYCQHNTDGVDCEKCLPFYNDLPWKRGTMREPFECKPCNCNGLSDTCEFDADLYSQTGYGGRCTDCRENTSGPHCEFCAVGFYKDHNYNRCFPCFCNIQGSVNEQCEMGGACLCKEGVHGEKCDLCLPYHYNLTITGCDQCRCNYAGILEGTERLCDANSGQCMCKEFVQGQNCDECKPGYFGLAYDNALGCTKCFCYGHSSECSLHDGYHIMEIKSSFRLGSDGWKGEAGSEDAVDVEHLSENNEITLGGADAAARSHYFVAPANFLGDIHQSHNLLLTFDLRISSSNRPVQPQINDIMIVGGNGVTLQTPIYSQGNPIPNEYVQHYKFVLGEHQNYQWHPIGMSNVEFARVLFNVTAIKIKAVYSDDGAGFLSNVVLQTVSSSSYTENEGSNVVAVEFCKCPEGYVGQFCESCAPGYKRHVPHSGAFGVCVPCQCNGHSDHCEAESGQCMCEHSTTGTNCELCMDGYYGNAMNGTADDCTPCGCPDGNKCIFMEATQEVVCLDCADGYGGLQCDVCDDGYYAHGEYDGNSGTPLLCKKCQCNNNADPNDVAQCHYETGKCLKCLYNTTGDACQHCLPGFYGAAVDEPHGACYACDCYHIGTLPEELEVERNNQIENNGYISNLLTCERDSGQCRCRDNVVGRRCDQCLDGTWNIASGEGCEDCSCNLIGSFNSSCDVRTGQCHCKPGVGGAKCDQCLPYYYGFSDSGCSKCSCDFYGSFSLECHNDTGLCPCRHNYEGRACDQCAINRYNLKAGCVECPVCYGKVRDVYQGIQTDLNDIQRLVLQAGNLTTVTLDDDDDPKLKDEVRQKVQKLLESVKSSEELDITLKLKNECESIKELKAKLDRVDYKIFHLNSTLKNAKKEVDTAESLLESAEESIDEQRKKLKKEGDEELETIKRLKETSGRQSKEITSLASDARSHVTLLKQQKEVMENCSASFSNVTDEIHKIEIELARQQINHTEQMKNLNAVFEHSKNLLKIVQKNSTDILAASTIIHNDTHFFLKEVYDTEMPKINVDELSSAVADIEAEEETSLVDKLSAELSENKNEIERVRANVSDSTYQMGLYLEEYNDLKMQIELKFNDANETEHSIKDTVTKSEETLNKLETFEAERQSKKKAADDAKTKLNDINLSVATSEKALTDVSRDLWENNALNDVTASASFLLDVMESFNKTKKIYENNVETYMNSLNESEIMLAEHEVHFAELDKAELLLNNFEEKNEEEYAKMEKIHIDVGETLITLEEDIEYVCKEGEENVNAVIHNLNKLEPFNMANFKRCQDEMEKNTDKLRMTNFNERFITLKERGDHYKKMTEAYREEMTRLTNEVNMLETISKAIPWTCVTTEELEVAPISWSNM